MKLLLKAKFKSLSSVKKIIYGFFWRAYRRLKARYRKFFAFKHEKDYLHFMLRWS